VPYPVDAIPYAVTRFAYREYCWSPALTEKEFRARLLDRFFGPAAPASLADDLVGLFDVIRTQSQNQRLSGRSSTAWSRGCLARALDEADHALRSAGREPVPYARLQELAELVARQGKALGQIEEHLGAAEAQLSARGKETLVLIRRALADTRRELCLEPASAERVRELADRARRVLAERRKSLPAVAEAASEHGPRYAAENVLDGNLDTSWLAKDRALLPQAITITFRKAQKIDYVRLVQGNYHPAYNTQAYRVECSPNGSSFALLWAGELPNRPGAAHVERFAPREALGLRIVVTSVYPNIDYSSPSLAEVDFGLGGRSGLAP
jgi:hypothetical protein